MGDNDDLILVERKGSVAIVRFNRPDQLNAIVPEMAYGYARRLRECNADPEVRAVVLTGNGRAFCAGADLSVIAAGPDAITATIPPLADLPAALGLRLSKPLVAAVNGPVAGIGFAYMLGSDVRFAADDAKISTTFARLGLVAEYGLSWLLPRMVGLGRAMDLLLSGRTITGDQAQRLGLVEYALPAAEVFDAALAYATDLADNCSPRSLAHIKAQVLADLTSDLDSALARARWFMHNSFPHPDLAEALAARTDKRAAAFAPPTGSGLPD